MNPDQPDPWQNWFAGAVGDEHTLWEQRLETKQPKDSPFVLPSDLQGQNPKQNQNPAPAQPTLPQPQTEN